MSAGKGGMPDGDGAYPAEQGRAEREAGPGRAWSTGFGRCKLLRTRSP